MGVIGLEKPSVQTIQHGEASIHGSVLLRFILGNRQAKHFFVYLVILLVALLGQDILLEPFGAQAFGLTVKQTTRITSIWGTCVLAALLVAGRVGRACFQAKNCLYRWVGCAGRFCAHYCKWICCRMGRCFTADVVLLGLGTGLSTVSNLSLMLDMTTAEHVGLFIGAWGMANAFSRLLGSLMAGAVRDLVTRLSGDPLLGYVIVFALMAVIMLVIAFHAAQGGCPALFVKKPARLRLLLKGLPLAGEPG